jgi:hypothetical protein
MSFTKGKSGNPAGRPRSAQELASLSGPENETFESWIQNRINSYIKENFHCLEKIDTPDGLKRARIFCEVLKYAASKPGSKKDRDQKFEFLPTEQLEEVVRQLREKSVPHFTLANHPALHPEHDPKESIRQVIGLVKAGIRDKG